MSQRALTIGAAVVLAVALFFLLRKPKPRTDEEQIRDLVADLATKAGNRDLSGMMEHVSERYRDQTGADAHEVKQVLAALVLRGEFNAVQILGETVTVQGSSATDELTAILTRISGGQGVEVGRHKITLRLEREGPAWKVVSSTHD